MSSGTTAGADAANPPGIRPDGPYWASLDGLRALAMIGIFAYHVWPPSVPGASICVDLFFVLSAFLITFLLVREHRQSGRIRLRRFYARRALRLLPVLLVVGPAAAAAAWLALPALRPDVWPSLRSTLLYYANFRAAAHPTHMAVFLPTWSLSTEEQFYLLWPTALVVLLLIGLRARALATVSAGLLLLNTAWLQVSWDRGTSLAALYYRPDLRVTGILVGTTLGLLFGYDRLPRRDRLRTPLTALTVAGVVFVTGYMFRPQVVPARYQATAAIVVACLAWGAIVVQQVVIPLRPLSLLLDNPVARWIGRTSYTIYLLHVPVIHVVRQLMGHPGPAKVGLVAAAVTLALTGVVHYAIERPALRLKDRRAEPPDAYGVPAQTPRIPAWSVARRQVTAEKCD